jgi:hypothetical protein
MELYRRRIAAGSGSLRALALERGGAPEGTGAGMP